jgi:hypothetical protein
MRLAAAAIGLLVLGTLAGGAYAARSAKPAGGTIRIYAPTTNGAAGTLIVTGAIGDYGKTLQMTKSGKADGNGNYIKATLQKGTFMINLVRFNAILNKAGGSVNKTTCSFSFGGTGPVTLFNGTGLYSGISGTVSVTLSFVGVGPLYASGKNKGKCDMRNSTKLLAQGGAVQGAGAVKFG